MAAELQRTWCMEELEIELLRLEREESAVLCAEAAQMRLSQAALGDENAAQVGACAPPANAAGCTSGCAQLPALQGWRLRVAQFAHGLALEGRAAPGALAAAFGAPPCAWPSASVLAEAACAAHPCDEHRLVLAQSLLAEGRTEAARSCARTLPPHRRCARLEALCAAPA